MREQLSEKEGEWFIPEHFMSLIMKLKLLKKGSLYLLALRNCITYSPNLEIENFRLKQKLPVMYKNTWLALVRITFKGAKGF